MVKELGPLRRNELISLESLSPGTEIQPKGRIKIIGWDKDGTILNNMADWPVVAAEQVSKNFGVDEEFAYKFFLSNLGSPFFKQIEFLVTDVETGELKFDKEHIESAVSDIRVTLYGYPALPYYELGNTLNILKREGYRMFVSSFHPEHKIREQLEGLALAPFFETYIGVDSKGGRLEKGEPHFRLAAERMGIPYEAFKRTTAYIGDSKEDAKNTKAAGLTFIGRAGFTATKQELYSLDADIVVDDYTLLPHLLPNIR